MTSAPPTGRRRALAAVVVGLVALVAVLGVGTVLRRHRGVAGTAASGTELRAVIPGLQAFVEAARGLRFLAPVAVSVLDDAAFRKKFDEGGSTDQGAPDVQSGVLMALGLLGDGEGAGPEESDADSVAGFYDSDTKELVVRGTRPTPFVRQVLVHELTHALDDQHFGLDPDLADDEAALAYDALVEGDATAVEYRYVDSLSAAEQQEAADEEGSSDAGGAYDPMADLADFPYTDGPDLIHALVAAGGQARVDAAFRSPPTTSAEVLHPARFLSGRGRAPVPRVAADGKVVDDGVLGEFLLRLVLGETVPAAEAETAAAGWAGDHYVAWRSGRRTCLRATVVLDSPSDVGELASGLRRWAAAHPGAIVDASSTVTLSRCA